LDDLEEVDDDLDDREDLDDLDELAIFFLKENRSGLMRY